MPSPAWKPTPSPLRMGVCYCCCSYCCCSYCCCCYCCCSYCCCCYCCYSYCCYSYCCYSYCFVLIAVALIAVALCCCCSCCCSYCCCSYCLVLLAVVVIGVGTVYGGSLLVLVFLGVLRKRWSGGYQKTGLGFVIFVVFNPRMLSKWVAKRGFFVGKNFTPPPSCYTFFFFLFH